MYEEPPRIPRWKSAVVLLVLLLTLSYAWIPEFDNAEAVNAQIARHLVAGGDYLVPQLNGAPVDHSPLAPWLISALFRVLPDTEPCARLAGILPLLALAALCGGIAYRTAGVRAAAATIVATVSNTLALRSGMAATADMLFALFINASWFSWYFYCREQKAWLYGWCIAHGCVFLAFLSGGMKALFYFYFPLLLLRRPLKIWRRLRQPDYLLAAMVFASAILTWIFLVPYQLEGVQSFYKEFQISEPRPGYLLHVGLYPLQFAWSYFPWILLVWPAYCMAFIPLEKSPILMQYLRTIAISIAIFFWLAPEFRVEVLLPLIGPLSIQVGQHYGILVRRYGRQLFLIPRSLATCTLCGLVVAWPTVAVTYPQALRAQPPILAAAIVCSLTAAIGSVLLLRRRLHGQIWFAVAASVAIVQLGFAGTYGLVNRTVLGTKRALGTELASKVPEAATVYEIRQNGHRLHVERYYLQRQVVCVDDVTDFPIHEDTIYVLGSVRAPIDQSRRWMPVSKSVQDGGYQLRVWKGEKRVVDISPARLDFGIQAGRADIDVRELDIQIANISTSPIDVVGLESRAGHLICDDIGPVLLLPRESRQFRIRVQSDMVMGQDIYDTIFVTMTTGNRILTRTIEAAIHGRAPTP